MTTTPAPCAISRFLPPCSGNPCDSTASTCDQLVLPQPRHQHPCRILSALALNEDALHLPLRGLRLAPAQARLTTQFSSGDLFHRFAFRRHHSLDRRV